MYSPTNLNTFFIFFFYSYTEAFWVYVARALFSTPTTHSQVASASKKPSTALSTLISVAPVQGEEAAMYLVLFRPSLKDHMIQRPSKNVYNFLICIS